MKNLCLFVLVLGILCANSIIFDKSSFLVITLSEKLLNTGLEFASKNEINETTRYFEKSFEIYQSEAVLFHMINLLKFNNLNPIDWLEKMRNKYPLNALILMYLGIEFHLQGNFPKAISLFSTSLSLEERDETWFSLGVSFQYSGFIDDAANAYDKCLRINHSHNRARLNIATLFHLYGDTTEAINHYRIAISQINNNHMNNHNNLVIVNPNEFPMLVSNLGSAYVKNGQILEAIDILEDLEKKLEDAILLINCPNELVALIYNPHKYINQHILNIKNNDTNNNDNNENIENNVLNASEEMSKDCKLLFGHLKGVLNNLALAQRTSCDWKLREKRNDLLLYYTLYEIYSNYHTSGPLLPFDSLLLPVDLKHRLLIASSFSHSILHSIHTNQFTNTISALESLKHNSQNTDRKKLRIGFISYDFNNHPTAHLIEAIFHYFQKFRNTSKTNDFSQNDFLRDGANSIELIVFSYGNNDNSTYRNNIIELSDEFEDISLLSFEQSADLIFSKNINILLEMQLHTFGNRLQIGALVKKKLLSKLSQNKIIVINYLVYPGTSGCDFIDLIVSDKVVTQIENFKLYSESLLLLPTTYQISFYDRHLDYKNIEEMNNNENNKTYLRRINNLPTEKSSIVFCNFNKMDKLDPLTFHTWMNILSRVPNSYLWLLQPSTRHIKNNENENETSRILFNDGQEYNSLIQINLLKEAKLRGISPKRFIFAPRVNKAKHISRHKAADLFLDSFIYGAHSTATDALRGGLAVLTMAGNGFPSLVSKSLYSSFKNNVGKQNELLLVRDNVKDFENTAVEFVSQYHENLYNHDNSEKDGEKKSKKILLTLEENLRKQGEKREGLFSIEIHVEKLIRSWMVVNDVQISNIKRKSFLKNNTSRQIENEAFDDLKNYVQGLKDLGNKAKEEMLIYEMNRKYRNVVTFPHVIVGE